MGQFQPTAEHAQGYPDHHHCAVLAVHLLYSEYLVFGENIGFLIDVLTVTSWQLVIPLGVMGIWTLMSELRVYIIIFVLLASVVLHLVSDRKEDAR